MKNLIFVGALLLSLSITQTAPSSGPTLPTTCAQGNPFYLTSGVGGLYVCNGSNTYVLSSGIPSGAIFLISSNTCPSGFTEQSNLSGKTLFGTVAANGDVGGTGGSDNITPTGTNGSLTFTGTPFTAVINHTHTVTGVGSAATGSTTNLTGASDTSSTTATTANPAGGVASITPAGTINTPTFTGNSFDNRSAFMKVIFCKKD